ncbi:MAG TPA: GLUG motif-containing protein, partial [Methanoculleus sp.]|nr:GLUG motif-containing protein [Methanoculleus sp.]
MLHLPFRSSYPWARPGIRLFALALLLCLALVGGASAASFEVATYDDLCKVGTGVDGWTLDADYIQTADIQCPVGVSFTPIGENDPFIGSYDGRGYVIRDLYINRPGYWDVGLFGEVAAGAALTNITLEDVSITGDDNTGGLVGYGRGLEPGDILIKNCTVSGVIDVLDYGAYVVGGLAGYLMAATVTDCHADVQLYSSHDDGSVLYVGGLIGEADACNISSSSASGNISDSDEYGGGLIGYCYDSTITDCHAHGDVAIDPDAQYQGGPNGGLVGYLYMSSAFNCSATGDVIGGWWETGALVGFGYRATVARCYASGNVSGYEHVGGLIGYYEPRADYSLEDCYATGNVVSSGSSTNYCSAGGLIGLWDQYNLVLDGHIKNVYSTGSVSAPNLPAEAVGGLIGQIDYGTGVVATAAYWDTETSGQAASAGGAVGKTTAEMQALATFANWSIATPAEYTDEVWFIVEGEDYPRLAWQGVPSVSPPPVASFTASPTSGTAPLTVQFTDTSTNAPT